MVELPEGPVPAARLLFVSIAGLEPSAWRRAGRDADARRARRRGGRRRPRRRDRAGERVPGPRDARDRPLAARARHAGRSPLGRHGVRSERYWHASQLHGASLWQLAAREPRADRRARLAGHGRRRGRHAAAGPRRRRAAASATPTSSPSRRRPALAAAVATPAGGEAAAPGRPRARSAARDLACKTAEASGTARAAAPPPHADRAGAPRSDGPGSAAARGRVRRRRRRARATARVLRRRGPPRRTAAVAVVGDRGFEPIHSVVLPNAALAEAAARRPRAGGRRAALARARALERRLRIRVRARRGHAPSRRARCSTGLARRSGAFRVVPAAEMSARGADPDAWFGLDAAAGLRFRRRRARAARSAPPRRAAASGRLRPERGDAGVRRVRARLPARRARPADVAARRRADPRRGARRSRSPGAEGRALVGLCVGAPPVARSLACRVASAAERRSNDRDRAQPRRAPALRPRAREPRREGAGTRSGLARPRCS